MLHRPYTSRSLQGNLPHGPGFSHARLVCLDSATAIAKLLQIFEKQHTLRRANVHVIYFIFSAALIMVYAMLSQPGTEESDSSTTGPNGVRMSVATHLSTCFRALDETSTVFERARHVCENLVAIQRRWNRERRDRTKSKRAIEQRQGDEARKRRLTGLERPEPFRPASSASFRPY